MTPSRYYTVLVNSSDGFADCWGPFFALFARYWPSAPTPVLLNTERTNWHSATVDVRCTRIAANEHARLSWGECLLRALERVETPLVLYLQEDYFLEAPVRADRIERIAAMVIANPQISHVGLTTFGSGGPFQPSEFDGLVRVSDRAPYRVNTQAGLWRVDALRSYVRADENGWMFEILGTRRSWKRHDLFLTVDPGDRSVEQAVVRYTHTGIIKGRWHPAMPALFQAHAIEMDFSRRGFHRPSGRMRERMGTVAAVRKRPFKMIRGLLGF